MIVGSKTININELRIALESRATLNEYVLKLIPPAFRHVRQIVDNQKYIVAMHIRKMKLNFRHKENIINELIQDVTVQGSINTLVDIDELLVHVNFDYLLTALFQDEIEAYERSIAND